MKKLTKRNGYLGILLLGTDGVFVFLVWLLRPSAIKSVGIFILLFSLLMLGAAWLLERRYHNRTVLAWETLLENPTEEAKMALLLAAGAEWEGCIDEVYEKITRQSAQINESKAELTAYRDFIEEWVHEAKTPLSLSALILNNRREEMSPYVYERMNHVQQQLNADVEKILYYARLWADHADYKFTEFRLDLCVQELVEEYAAYAGENMISVHLDLQPLALVSDEKVLRFMISQLLGNAYKYADPENGEAAVSVWQQDDRIFLAVRNNGTGIPAEDAPFIFDKGFTGNHPNRQKATGMGLYLVWKYAEALCADVALEPFSTEGKGFGIQLIFTR